MKSNNNENRSGLAQKALVLCGICVLVATAFGAGFYSKLLREIENGQQDSVVLDRLVEARRYNELVKELNNGQLAEAKKFLKRGLADDIHLAQMLAATADPAAVAEVKFALKQLALDQQAHPEYYLTEVKSPQTIQIARHEVKQR